MRITTIVSRCLKRTCRLPTQFFMAAQTEGTTLSPSSGSYTQNNVSDAEYVDSEQLGKDLEKFSESIVTGKIDAVDTLRHLHTKNAPARLALVRAVHRILKSNKHQSQMHEMYDSGILHLMVDITTEWDFEEIGRREPQSRAMQLAYILMILEIFALLVLHAQGNANDCCYSRRNAFIDYTMHYSLLSEKIWHKWVPYGLLSPHRPLRDKDMYLDADSGPPGPTDRAKLIAIICVGTARLHERLE